jgi:hypothetical protein
VQYAKNVLFRPRAPLLISQAWRERRGLAIFNATFVRKGDAVHEVLRPSGLAGVNAAGADFVFRLMRLNDALAERSSGLSRDSIFTGQIARGEIYNQAQISCRVAGTRWWVQLGQIDASVAEVETMASQVAEE